MSLPNSISGFPDLINIFVLVCIVKDVSFFSISNKLYNLIYLSKFLLITEVSVLTFMYEK